MAVSPLSPAIGRPFLSNSAAPAGRTFLCYVFAPVCRTGLASRASRVSHAGEALASVAPRPRRSRCRCHPRPDRRSRRRGMVVMAKGPDYYATLNLRQNATLQEIKAAYRSLTRKVGFFMISLSVSVLYVALLDMKGICCTQLA